MELESDGDNNCNWCARYSHKRIGKRTRGLGNKRTGGDYPNDNSIIKIGQNTEKSERLEETCCHTNSSEKPSIYASVKNPQNSKIIISDGTLSENKRKQKDKRILGPCQGTKKAMKYKGDGDINCSWCTWKSLQKLRKENGKIGKQQKNRDPQDYNIDMIG